MAETDERAKKMSAASNAASKRLKQAHEDEWNGYMAEETSQRGIDWKPRLSADERRREQFKALLAEDPSLADLLSEDDAKGSPEVEVDLT